MDKLKTMQEEE